MRRLAPLVLVFLAASAAAQDPAADFGAWFLKMYGAAGGPGSPDRALVERAQEVFASLLPIVDQQARRRPRLLVVNRADGIEAQALPDGTVVANPALLRFCFGGAQLPKAQGDARLAFVLGHEIAHLAYDDAWHAEAFASVRRYGDSDLLEATRTWAYESAEERQAKELRADRAGFLYLLLAGYSSDGLVDRRSDFLREWSRHVGATSSSGGSHPSLARRSELLRVELTSLQATRPFHRFGVRLLSLGRYADAIPLLERFRREFPSRESGSNLALAYYYRALAQLALCGDPRATRFRLPVILDPQTLAARLQLRAGGRAGCALPAEKDLDEAERLLRQSVANDPDYVPARLNLAAVLATFGPGFRGKARDAYGVATAGEPAGSSKMPVSTQPRLAVVAAVAFHQLGPEMDVETTATALAALDQVAGLETADHDVRAAALFNAARIQHDLGRSSARAAWKKYLAFDTEPPWADEARVALLPEAPPPAAAPPAADRGPLEGRLSAATKKSLPKRAGSRSASATCAARSSRRRRSPPSRSRGGSSWWRSAFNRRRISDGCRRTRETDD